jgi:hypothetical protein
MTVTGPGQKAAARRRAGSGQLAAKAMAAVSSATWTISGWPTGRPLAL